jgi:hypothetical protein
MIFEILLLVVGGFLSGLLIANLCGDELVEIRPATKWLFIVGVLLGVWMFLIGKQVEGYVSLFAGIVGIVGYWKSWDKKLTKRKN